MIEITPHQGSKKTGGKWSRPDVTIVTVKSYPFIPGKVLDVISFEIKPANDFDVKGVFETTAHSRFAHKSYLAIHVPEGIPESNDEFDNLVRECIRFGIGLICFTTPTDWSEYAVKIESKRKNPDPQEINRFISNQMSTTHKNDILNMLK